MPDSSHDYNSAEFPRFLSRDDVETCKIVKPPPLPYSARWPLRALTTLRPRAFFVAAAIAVPAIASAAYLTKSRPIHPLQRRVALVAVQPRIAPPDTSSTEIATAVQIVAQLEARLGYAPNLTSQVQSFSMAGGQSTTVDSITTALPPAFSAPAEPVSETAWIEAAANPDLLVVTPNGEKEIVAIDAEMTERQTAPLSALHLDLGSVAVTTDASENDADATSAPRRRKHRVHHQKVRQAAVEDESEAPPRHVRRHRVAKVKDVETAQESADPNADKVSTAEEEAQKGPIAKLFSWLKGKKKPAADDDDANRTGLGMRPEN